MARILSAIKAWFVPSGTKVRIVKLGLLKGLKMNLDFRSDTQTLLGLWEKEIHSYMRTFTREAKTGIDVGASEGAYSLYFLSQANIRRVYAFEPSESESLSMLSNLSINGFREDHRLMLIHKYVANHDDHDHCTLDSLAVDLEGPCVVKIDIEGGEREVLKGAEKLLDRRDVSWVIETHSAELEKECVQVLTSKGLATKIIKDAWWRLIIPEQRPITPNRWLVAWHE